MNRRNHKPRDLEKRSARRTERPGGVQRRSHTKASRQIFVLSIVSATIMFMLVGLTTGKTGEVPEEVGEHQDTFKSNEDSGRWRKFRKDSVFGTQKAESLTEKQLEVMRQLEALGYVEGMWPAPAVSGVTMNLPDRTSPGFNFFVSGHAPEAILMDMEGAVLHKWSHEYPKVITEKKHLRWTTSWRRAHLYENGDILALWENLALVRLDRNSQLKWAYFGKPHHDIFVSNNGMTYVLAAKAATIPAIRETKEVMEHFVDVLDNDGNLIKRLSILDCFRNSAYYWPLFESLREFVEYRSAVGEKSAGDIIHSNTIQVLDGSQENISPIYRKGNLVVCLREPGIVAIIDPEKEAVVWALSGMWRRQHDSTLLEHGRMLIFDNKGNGGFSRIMEIDPFSQKIFWKFEGDPPIRFYSSTCGAVQRLQNGNTLITESNNGRAFEVARDGTIVWEFVSPFRAGEKNELIATLYDLVRIPEDWDLEWLDD